MSANPALDWAAQQIKTERIATQTGMSISQVEGTLLGKPPVTQEGLGGQSVLGRVFDVLQRGEYASANIAKQYAAGIDTGDVDWSAAWRGFTGKEKHTYDEIVEQQFPDWSWGKKFGVSLVLSIVADPTTWIPLGWTGKLASKALSPAAKAIEKTATGRKFITAAGTPLKYKKLRYFSQTEKEAAGGELVKEVKYLAQGLSKEDAELLSYYRELPKKITPENYDEVMAELETMPIHLKHKLEEVGGKFQELFDELKDAGQLSPQQLEAWEKSQSTYLHHSYDRSGSSGSIPPRDYAMSMKPGFFKKRKFETLEDAKVLRDDFVKLSDASTVDEFKAFAKDKDLEKFFAFGDDLDFTLKDYQKQAKHLSEWYNPEENIIKLYAKRKSDQISFLAQEKFIDSSLTQFGKKAAFDTVAPEGYQLVYPKGKLRIFMREAIDPKADKAFRSAAEELSTLATRTTRTTQTVAHGAAGLATSGPMARVEQIVRESLELRGMTKGEAETYILRIKQASNQGEVGDIITEVSEQVDIVVNGLIQGAEGGLLDANMLDVFRQKFPSITKRVPAYLVPNEIADDLTKAGKWWSGDKEATFVGKWFDRLQGAWKLQATVWRLPFHLRNAYSNMFQAYLGGVKNPTNYIEAIGLQSGTLGKINIKGVAHTRDDFIKLAKEKGVLGRGWIGGESHKKIAQELEHVFQTGTWKTAKRVPKMILSTGPRAVGMAFENNARLALFAKRLRLGDDAETAAWSVKKYLFDYSELTDFEKTVMRRAFPFYTWTRKNAPLQFEQLFMQPQKYAKYPKVLRAASEPETGEERSLKPKYFDELMYVKTPLKSDQGKPLYMSLDLPPLELNRITSLKNYMNMLSPWKALLDVRLNRKDFPTLNTPIQHDPYDKATAPVWVNWLPEPIKKSLADNHLIGIHLNPRTKQREMGIDKKFVYLAHTALPVLSEAARMYAQPAALWDERPDLFWRRYLTGAGVAGLDLQAERMNEVWREYEVIEHVQEYAKEHGKLPDKKELEGMLPENMKRSKIWNVENK